MNRKKGRLLACALAVAVTNFAFVKAPVVYAQDDGEVYTTADEGTTSGQQLAVTDRAETSQDTGASPTADEETLHSEAPSGAESSNKIKPIDIWKQQRPSEDDLTKTENQYDGQIVVSVDVTGLETLPASTVSNVVKIKAGDTFKGSNVEADRQAIYETGLFYDNFPTYEVVPEGVKITYHVMENPVLHKVNISGNKELPEDKIRSMLTVKEGELLNSKTLSDDIANIEAAYRKEGYILAKIDDMSINEDGVLNLKFNEGVLEGYSVKGNDKTKEKVITREMRMKPGDTFNAKLAKRSMQRIYNLGFFEDVNMKLLPGKNPNGVIIETTVVEKRTGSFGVGAGYSNSDGVIGMISLSDSNFRGTGDAAKLTYEFGGNDDDDHGISFSYRHPWLDSKETSMTLRLYDRTYEYYDYNTDGHEIEGYNRNYKGGEITFGRPVNEYTTNFITLKNRQDEYKGHEEGDYDRSNETAWLDSNFGTTRSIILTHSLDTRDNVYNPTQGSTYSIAAEFAGMGGDFNYNKYMFNSQRFYNLGHSHVLALRLDGGYSDNDLPEAGQFQIGGQGSLRGYKDDQFKGNNMISGSVEYRFPVVTKVQGALFFDMGDAWSGKNWQWQSIEDSFSLHHSYGIGIQIETPVGPLRLDYGIGEDGGRTNFSVGGTF
ncbi:BamA/OMP85 family outer membrane protein [Pectinatus haikarae]|uniref:Outer membrane protein insertion porin family n=1 Tax=Pectinatus haikarae TaxID=349096 RepID=A0ABT9Y5H2_9FIRM|nr:BamA/TamA family outer membrane protein [Pectinatus haikarae]MDQ0203078.1 outer membrane protein insertion porin family [Pectinatus haikarae]